MPNCESLQQMRVRVDSDLRRNTQGTALIGGSPTRLIRLTQAGAELFDAWAAGAPVGSGRGRQKLAHRLLDAGLLHPDVATVDADAHAPVGVVIPVFNDVDGLTATLVGIRRELPLEPIIVVDDHSADAPLIARVAARHDARVIRHTVNRGPAAARNTGWRALLDELPDDSVVVFVDADVVPTADSIGLLRAHFVADMVAAVAPRVAAAQGTSVIDRYEVARSPLDLGSEPGRVRAGSRVSYVPAAALLVRRAALEQAGGFSEEMRSGEDVDFVWRVDRAGWHVRYEPAATVTHRNRPSARGLARQRFIYGRAAADLAERHGDDVAPVAASKPMLATWIAAICGPPVAKLVAVAGAAGMAVRLRKQISGYSDAPTADAVQMSARSHLSLGRWLATASTRAWLPLLVAASVVSRRARRWLVAAVVGPALVEWSSERPSLDPLRFAALRLFDDAAYCAGVTRGVVTRRSIKALLPRFLPSGFHRAEASDPT